MKHTSMSVSLSSTVPRSLSVCPLLSLCCLYVCLPDCPPTSPSCLYICPPLFHCCLPIYLSVCPPCCPSVLHYPHCPSVYLSVLHCPPTVCLSSTAPLLGTLHLTPSSSERSPVRPSRCISSSGGGKSTPGAETEKGRGCGAEVGGAGNGRGGESGSCSGSWGQEAWRGTTLPTQHQRSQVPGL